MSETTIWPSVTCLLNWQTAADETAQGFRHQHVQHCQLGSHLDCQFIHYLVYICTPTTFLMSPRAQCLSAEESVQTGTSGRAPPTQMDSRINLSNSAAPSYSYSPLFSSEMYQYVGPTSSLEALLASLLRPVTHADKKGSVTEKGQKKDSAWSILVF